MSRTAVFFAVALACSASCDRAPNAGPDSHQATPSAHAVGEWVRVGDRQVMVTGAGVGRLAIFDAALPNGREDERESLIVSLEIQNLSKTRRFTYSTWRASRTAAQLHDEHGNEYRQHDDGAGRIAKVADIADLDPGSPPHKDIIAFQVPLPVATRLFLELDEFKLDAGASGSVRFSIPWQTAGR